MLLNKSMLIAIVLGLAVAGGARTAESAEVSRAELIAQHKTIRLYREFDQLTRHLHFLLSNALLAVNGGWNDRDRRKTQVEVLSEQISGTIPKEIGRLKARIGREKSLAEEDAARLSESLRVFKEAAVVVQRISDILEAGDVGAANIAYADEALPLFEETWRGIFTLISGAERAFPYR